MRWPTGTRTEEDVLTTVQLKSLPGVKPVLVVLLAGLLAGTGCAAAPRTVSGPEATRPPAAVTAAPAAATATPVAKPAATATAAPTALPAGKPTAAAATPTVAAKPGAPLVLQVLEPADESEVTTPSVTVRGVTSAGAVVSVGDDLAEVDAGGAFSATVTLEEGPNVIEVVASDEDGNVLFQEILIIYEP
jgi:hypothetical protein